MTIGDWLIAMLLAFALAASGCLDGPSDHAAAQDVEATVQALGQP